jgi:predicted transcriptional regulator
LVYGVLADCSSAWRTEKSMTANTTTVELAAGITIAWLSNPNNRATVEDVPVILRTTYDCVAKLGNVAIGGDPTLTTNHAPAVSVRKSLSSPDHIISLLDGKPYKMLRAHLRNNGLTPEEYRARYDLKPDYPMVSASYSKARRAIAIKTGLGRTKGTRS